MAGPGIRPPPGRVLLIAQSARMLAQSCARAGWRAVAADLFADEDTCELTERCLAIPSRTDGFIERGVLDTANELAPPDGSAGLIYGSGIDTRPDLLERLMPGRILLGNTPETLRLVKTPRRFFRLLDELGIAHPDTRFTPPDSPGPWLVKPAGGEGGRGVRYWKGHSCTTTSGDYYQRFLQGAPMSALFVANGTGARIIGFNTLWTSHPSPGQPFLFAGAINRAALNDDQRETVARYAARIARAVGLVGLNGLDFMVDGSTLRVLEVNPRPTASMQLYDADRPGGWLQGHVAACRDGVLATAPPGPVRAFRIVYSAKPTVVPEGIAWPDECFDRPPPGSRIDPGEPFCTVTCEAECIGEAVAMLQARMAEVLRRTTSP